MRDEAPEKQVWDAPMVVRLDGVDRTQGKYAFTFVSEGGHFLQAGATRYGVYDASSYAFNAGTGAPGP